MARGFLRAALAAEKGVDFKALKQKKKYKAALKAKKQKKSVEEKEEEEEEEEDEEEEDGEEDDKRNGLIDDEASESDDEEDEDDEDEEEEQSADLIAAMDDSDLSDSEVEMEEKLARPKKAALPPRRTANVTAKTMAARKADKGDGAEDDEEDEDEEEEEEVAWSDLDEEERASMAVQPRQTIYNAAALTAAYRRLAQATTGDGSASATASTPHLVVHMAVLADGPPTAAAITDIQDDVARELQLYRQSRAAVLAARATLRAQEGRDFAFSRPADYFAEMVKDDGHMALVRAKLVEAATAKKASAEARKQRELKKFGKAVQVAKLQERAKAKRETLDQLKTLKRKRQDGGGGDVHEADDLFDVAVEKEIGGAGKGGRSAGRPGTGRGGAGMRSDTRSGSAPQPNAKRQKRNEKYGFGGKKKHSKSGDARSAGDLSGFDAKRMKSGGFKAQRPGKARRKAASGRR